jgi:putative tricarboxylic transport membrane protein
MLTILAGGAGIILARLDYPAVPLILGLVLGPLLERNIRRTLIQSQGDLLVFIERPIALGLFTATVLVLLIPLFLKLTGRKKIAADEAEV